MDEKCSNNVHLPAGLVKQWSEPEAKKDLGSLPQAKGPADFAIDANRSTPKFIS